jgi:hypothetical protein
LLNMFQTVRVHLRDKAVSLLLDLPSQLMGDAEPGGRHDLQRVA